jgi:serine/threonine protein kinase
VSHNDSKDLFALKVIDKRKLMISYGKLDIIYNEISIHSKLAHENIIKLYNVHEDKDNINIIMEYAENGNLYELISKEKNGLTESKAFDYFIQVVNAVYYLHNNNIIHRDIKPENILIGNDNKIKLCDFGWAKELTLENRSTFCGTVEYMAPEIVGSENYDYSVDIWSLGILLYELLYGHSPFKASNTKNVILNIKTHELTYDDKNKLISKSCKDLIQKLLDSNPQKRLKIKDILEHPFVKKHSKKYSYKKKLSTVINEEKVKNNIKNNINDNENDNDYEKNLKKIIKRSNTKFISSKNGIQLFAQKGITFPEIDEENEENNENKGKKNSLKSNKQLDFLEKFKDSLNVQLEKAKKSIENISFKNTTNCTFEDFRDGQFNQEKTNESNNDIHHHHINKKYKKHKSSKYNNYMFNNLVLTDNNNNNNNKSNLDNKVKKSVSNKNIIIENDLEDIIDDPEEIAALDRLNKAYERFGKENMNIINE